MRAVLALAVAVPLLGCNQLKKVDDEGGDGGDCVPDEVQLIFDEHCAIPACHDNTNQGGVTLLPGSPVVGAMGGSGLTVVEIGSVENSYLAQKIIPGGNIVGGTPMPPAGPIPPEQIATVLGWIGGAPLACGGATMTDPTMTDTTMTMTATGTDTGDPIVECSLEAIQPGEDAMIEAGDAADLVPTDIAPALERACGCHYAGETSPPYQLYTGALDMRTHLGFQTTLPNGLLGYESCLERVNNDLMPPPYLASIPYGCNVFSDEDRALIVAWLEADAPDGATWMGI